MATFEVKDPNQIRQLLAMGVKQSDVVTVDDEVSPDMPRATYVVRNKVDLGIVAAYFGIDMPTDRGRPPINKLRQAIERHGSKLDDSKYESSSEATEKRYLITALVQAGNRISPEQVEITAGEVRNYAKDRAGKRGRLSKSLLVEAVKALYEWNGKIIDDSVTVEPLE